MHQRFRSLNLTTNTQHSEVKHQSPVWQSCTIHAPHPPPPPHCGSLSVNKHSFIQKKYVASQHSSSWEIHNQREPVLMDRPTGEPSLEPLRCACSTFVPHGLYYWLPPLCTSGLKIKASYWFLRQDGKMSQWWKAIYASGSCCSLSSYSIFIQQTCLCHYIEMSVKLNDVP